MCCRRYWLCASQFYQPPDSHVDITYWHMWQFQDIPGITLFLRTTKQCKHLGCISFSKVPCANPRYRQRLQICWKHSWKPFCKSLFISSVAFRMTSAASQNAVSPMLISVEEQAEVRAVTMFFANKSKTKSGRCAGALSRRRNQTKCMFSICRGVSFWPHP